MKREEYLKKYALLLVEYSLSLKKGERLFIQSTTLAEPLVREVYKEALKVGASVDVKLEFEGQSDIFNSHAEESQLLHICPTTKKAMEEYEAYLHIRAPFQLKSKYQLSPVKEKIRQQAMKPIQSIYFDRTADLRLKRTLCQFPTEASAQEAGMSLEDYEHFIFKACKLEHTDPKMAWLDLRKNQQKIVDYLNKCSEIQFKGPTVDLKFSTLGRKWINSDGQTNMPSGEVYTSPVEDSVDGHILFSFDSIYRNNEVKEVSLEVKDGEIKSWDASDGKDFLDKIFEIPGTRRFGEAAIGTNYDIDRITKNILFDEKIGGSIHLAIGQSYKQAGGKNVSSVHWDMITDMTNGGTIFADGQKVYENGNFLI